MEFIHSVMVQDKDVLLVGVDSYDLPVNPLSHILLTMKFTHTQANLADISTFAEELALITKIEVLYKGSAVFSMSGADAFACGLLVPGFESWGLNEYGATVEERSLTWCIPLGRKLYDPVECFPRTTRGELILQVTYPVSPVDFPSTVAQIETVELPDAAPERYLRMTTLSATISATGETDVELPIGNPISDVVLYGETIPCAAADVATLGYMQILVDNIRRFYSHTNFETVHNMEGRLRAAPGYWGEHTHEESAAAGLAGIVLACDHVLAHYVRLPFDIFGDLSYALETAGKSDVIVRIGIDATAGRTVRVIPCEIVPAGRGY